MIPLSARQTPKQTAGTRRNRPVCKLADLSFLDSLTTQEVVPPHRENTTRYISARRYPSPSLSPGAMRQRRIQEQITARQEQVARRLGNTEPHSSKGSDTFIFPRSGTIRERMDWWCNHSSDTGVSSQTIAYCCAELTWGEVGGPPFQPSPPLDADDFGRCLRLIERIPEWRYELHKVVTKHLEWKGIVKEWDTLTEMYKDKNYHECTSLLRSIANQHSDLRYGHCPDNQ